MVLVMIYMIKIFKMLLINIYLFLFEELIKWTLLNIYKIGVNLEL